MTTKPPTAHSARGRVSTRNPDLRAPEEPPAEPPASAVIGHRFVTPVVSEVPTADDPEVFARTW
jgi:hypothetical protein